MAHNLTHTIASATSPLAVGPLRVRVLTSSPALSLTHLAIPAHTRGLPLLANRLHTTTYYVLSGSIRFSSTAPNSSQLQNFDASEGEVISIPPGTTYGFGNGDSEVAEVLCIYTPGEWVGALKELSGTPRENWKAVLKGWGCVLPEEKSEDQEMGDDDEEEDEDDEDDELTHVPARLRCMAG